MLSALNMHVCFSVRRNRFLSCLVPLPVGQKTKYRSGLQSPPPGDLPNTAIEPAYRALQAVSLPLRHQGSPSTCIVSLIISISLRMVHLLPLINQVGTSQSPNVYINVHFLHSMDLDKCEIRCILLCIIHHLKSLLCRCTTASFSIRLLMGIQVASMSGL